MAGVQLGIVTVIILFAVYVVLVAAAAVVFTMVWTALSAQGKTMDAIQRILQEHRVEMERIRFEWLRNDIARISNSIDRAGGNSGNEVGRRDTKNLTVIPALARYASPSTVIAAPQTVIAAPNPSFRRKPESGVVIRHYGNGISDSRFRDPRFRRKPE